LWHQHTPVQYDVGWVELKEAVSMVVVVFIKNGGATG
jgi:hypothetical protein